MFFACFKFKDGHVAKIPFEDREEARKFISDNYNPEDHEQIWTE